MTIYFTSNQRGGYSWARSLTLFSVGLLALLFFCLSAPLSHAGSETPPLLASYFKKNETIKGEVGAMIPPEKMKKYITKVRAAAQADEAWFRKFENDAPSGLPLPWHEKLGLTKEDYADYLKLWGEREFQVIHQVTLKLEEAKEGEWMIRVSGAGMPVTLLRFIMKEGHFRSPNGVMKRIEDINAAPESVLGGWKGQEWRYVNTTDFISTRENIALGKLVDEKHCLLVYRFQEETAGRRLADRSMVIRFSPPRK